MNKRDWKNFPLPLMPRERTTFAFNIDESPVEN